MGHVSVNNFVISPQSLSLFSVIVFDDYENHPGWRERERKAFAEFVARTGVKCKYLGFASCEPTAFRSIRACGDWLNSWRGFVDVPFPDQLPSDEGQKNEGACVLVKSSAAIIQAGQTRQQNAIEQHLHRHQPARDSRQ